jgi:hypothetical protein
MRGRYASFIRKTGTTSAGIKIRQVRSKIILELLVCAETLSGSMNVIRFLEEPTEKRDRSLDIGGFESGEPIVSLDVIVVREGDGGIG